MLFLNELEACLECTGPIEFQAIIPEIFPRLAKCIESLHFQVGNLIQKVLYVEISFYKILVFFVQCIYKYHFALIY